ncbi:MAG: DUF86 domain-containing protein [Bellilinea sp.]
MLPLQEMKSFSPGFALKRFLYEKHCILNEPHESHPEIPWSSMIGTRNLIVHGYDQVKLPIVWDILTKNLPDLRKSLSELAGWLGGE